MQGAAAMPLTANMPSSSILGQVEIPPPSHPQQSHMLLGGSYNNQMAQLSVLQSQWQRQQRLEYLENQHILHDYVMLLNSSKNS